jgi:hypothetical protein
MPVLQSPQWTDCPFVNVSGVCTVVNYRANVVCGDYVFCLVLDPIEVNERSTNGP